ncbi:MAG: NAD(P)/FAD-dependent oxidoreductase [Phycisphaerales bacterium]
MGDTPRQFDIIVIGGGPAGSTAALRAVRNGNSVLLLEKGKLPRFHIGESMLPRTMHLIRELGLQDRVSRVPQVPKFGASFVMANDETPSDFWFSPGPNGEESSAFNTERAPFDRMLLDAAVEAGATVLEETAVRSIDKLADNQVVLTTSAGEYRARVLLDASGQGTVVGRHLGTRTRLPDLERVAYFQHFHGVERRPGRLGGSPIFPLCDEGWFWLIPLDEHRTSIGVVMNAEIARSVGVPPDRMLRWAIDRSPFVRRAMVHAEGPEDNHVAADFSYVCKPYAGPGYFLVGDAATFVDPVFSTGVCMAMMSAVKAADGAGAILRGTSSPEAVRREYRAYVGASSGCLFRIVRDFYRHGCREMFLHSTGPSGVREAVLAAVAGHVFPKPTFATRWRLHLFHLLVRIHERWPLVPNRNRFSILDSVPPTEPPRASDLDSTNSLAGCA